MIRKLAAARETLPIVWPAIRKSIMRGQFFNPACEVTEPSQDVLCEQDVEVPMSEGYSLTMNIYRSKSAAERGEKVPVVMSAHIYDARRTPASGLNPLGGPAMQYRTVPQVGRPKFSNLTSWEAPDPDFWVRSGYAVANLNLPGYASSGGPPSLFSQHQGKCFYEAIEWVAAQDWCTGKVGLSGVSYLAISQYYVAACQAYGGPPPALRCISPWEGFTDFYQDLMCVGGVDEIGFPAFWWAIEAKNNINGPLEEFISVEGGTPAEMLRKHPFYDEWWKAKVPKLDEITLPMLVCASFSDHCLHTQGAFRAFEKVRSEQKWLYTHRTGKWDSYYSEEVLELTRRFMDCFLKDDDTSGFLKTPAVRLEVRDRRDSIHEVRFEYEWPLARTQYVRLYLDNTTRQLTREAPNVATEVGYSGNGGSVEFAYTFPEDTEITGYMKLRVWVEVRADHAGGDVPDDMVICTAASKLDRNGDVEYFYGMSGNKEDRVSRGFCRVSRRELNEEESTEWKPVLKNESERKLQPGEIVPIDISLFPSSTFFAAGESLQLIVSSNEIIKAPPIKKDVSINRGQHVLHAGRPYESYLLIPTIPIDGLLEGGEL